MIVLYSKGMYYTVQYCTIQYSIVLYSTVLYYTVQHCTIQYSIVLYSTVHTIHQSSDDQAAATLLDSLTTVFRTFLLEAASISQACIASMAICLADLA